MQRDGMLGSPAMQTGLRVHLDPERVAEALADDLVRKIRTTVINREHNDEK
jgi:hypothetical protein